jgi:hypothetical protein
MVFCDCSLVRIPEGVGLVIRTDRILAALPEARTVHSEGGRALEVLQTGDREYFARFGFSTLRNGLNVFRITGMDYRGYSLEEYQASLVLLFRSGAENGFQLSGSLSVRMESPSVKGISPCLVSSFREAGRDSSGKNPISAPFSLDFSEDSFFRPIRLYPVTGGSVGLYRWEASDSAWKCVGIPEMEGGSVTIRESGAFAFFQDGIPPVIGTVKIERVPKGSGYFKSYSYYVPVKDSGSGVDPYSSAVYWNGEPVVGQWDAIRGNLYIPVPSSRKRGQVELRVEISDRSGNRAVEEFGFMLQ